MIRDYSYVQSLEDRVAYLELKLKENGYRCQDNGLDLDHMPTPTSSSLLPETSRTGGLENELVLPQPSSNIEVEVEARTAAGTIASLAQNRPGHEPVFSKLFLNKLITYRTFPSIVEPRHLDNADGETKTSSNLVGALDTTPTILPTEEAAQHLVKAYFRLTKASLPLLHEPLFQQKLRYLYSLPRTIDFSSSHSSTDAKMTVFFVFGVFAVAILSLQKQNPSAIPTSLADRYHRICVRALDIASLPDDLDGVQALLLLTQYAYHHPTLWSAWKLVGAALRLAVEVRLHQEPLHDSLDALTLDIRRRTFWVAYAMDRNLSTSLGLPPNLPDGAISVKVSCLSYALPNHC